MPALGSCAYGAIIGPGGNRNTELVVIRVRGRAGPGGQERVTAVTHDRRSAGWWPGTDRADGYVLATP